MPAEFHFLRPEWLWGIPAVIACAVLLARRHLGPGNWQKVVDAALAPHVLSTSTGRRADLRWWLLGVGGIVAMLALAAQEMRLCLGDGVVVGVEAERG